MMTEPTSGLIAGIASPDAILRLAKYAPVFPCRRHDAEGFSNGRPVTLRAKSPLVENGFFAATQDEAQIREWWKRWPEALVGVPTGQRTKLVAIDWDPDKHTDITSEWIQSNLEALMCARTHGTMRGGKHYVYRVGNGQLYKTGTDIELGGVKRPGLDLRAEGGYIIWWPIHGGYASDNQAPFLPAGLIDERLERATAPREPREHSPVKWKQDKQSVVDALAYLNPTGRDLWRDVGMAIHLASMASDDGFAVWHAWSSGGISGEMPATYTGIDDCRYAWDSFKDKTAKPVTLGSIFHLAKQQGWGKAEEEPPPAEEPVQTAPSFGDVPRITAIMTIPAEPRDWFFEEIIPAGAFLIVGRPKVGKSWLLMQLAICAASCGDFLGFAALGAFGVLYICGEDDNARIQSRFTKFQVDPPHGMRVLIGDELRKRADAYREQMSLSQYIDGYLAANPDVKFVFLDTEATCRFVWEGENSGSKERAITKKDYADVREFDVIALKHRAFIGLVNHTSKRKNAGQWQDIHELINRTNTALAGASGSIVLADTPSYDHTDTESRVRVLGIRGRDISGDHLIAIEQLDTGAFQSLGPWKGYAQTEAERSICDGLIEVNAGAPEAWITAKEIAMFVGKSGGTVQRTVTRMLAAGRSNYKGFRFETKKGKGVKLTRIGGE